MDDVRAIFGEGSAGRRKAPHELNQDSSRSHALFTIHLITKGIDDELGNPVGIILEQKTSPLSYWLSFRPWYTTHCPLVWLFIFPTVSLLLCLLFMYGSFSGSGRLFLSTLLAVSD